LVEKVLPRTTGEVPPLFELLRQRFFMKLLSPVTLKWILVICIFTVLSFFLIYQYSTQLWSSAVKSYSILNDHYRFKKTIDSFGAYSPLAFILLQVVQVVVAPIPGAPVGFLGGFLFGAGAGFIYSTVGLTIGSWIAFHMAGFFEKWLVKKFVSSGALKKFDYLMGHDGVIISFLFFLIPGFPKDALCYILGLTPMRVGIFLVISTIGRIPGTLIATLQGAKAFSHQYTIFLILTVVSALITLVFYAYDEEIHKLIKKLK
jgi:uncharacterized membrane protein YdjX (TVP38/TMEM64 family)